MYGPGSDDVSQYVHTQEKEILHSKREYGSLQLKFTYWTREENADIL